MRVLVTGASGLVGLETVELLEAAGCEVTGVSRGRAARQRETVAWDLASEEPPEALRREWDAIVHAAADTRWTMTPQEAERANVATVAALRPLVSDRTHVVHVSTAYAIGLRGDATSDELGAYRNAYEWSKARAERLARELFPRLTIVRPPLIIGRRSDGRAARFAGMYTILRGMAGSIVPAVVAVPDAHLDAVPVDDVAKLLVEALDGGLEGSVATIAGGSEAPLVEDAVEVMTEALNEWRVENGHEPIEQPKLVSPDSWNRFFLPFARQHLTERQLRLLDLLGEFQPYLEVADPLEPTHAVTGIEPAIRESVHYWADQNRRLASLAPKPWKAAA